MSLNRWLAGAATVLLLTITTCKGSGQHRGSPAKYEIIPRVYEVDGCRTIKHFMIVHNTSVVMDQRGREFVNAHVTFTKGFQIFKKLTIRITRCTGGVAPGLCEYFTTWSWAAALCQLMHARGTLWTPIVRSVTPAFSCPVAAGPYEVRNASADLEVMDALVTQSGLYNHIWITEVLVHNEKEQLGLCFNFTFEVRRVRVRVRP